MKNEKKWNEWKNWGLGQDNTSWKSWGFSQGEIINLGLNMARIWKIW